MFSKKLTYSLSLIMFFVACVNSEQNISKDTLVIREAADASGLNPITAHDELSSIISMHLFQPLIGIDYQTEEVVGILAQSPPILEKMDFGKLKITYELRKEASFDNGRPILAKDILFSLKLNINPAINQSGGANYYHFIEKVLLDPNNPRSITFICQDDAVRNQFASGDFAILPWEVYDSNQLLSNYSFERLRNDSALLSDSTIIHFSEKFNDKKYSFSPNYIEGSAAYQLKSWNKGQSILLEKKEEWWGNEVNENIFFKANPSKIRFEIINDPISALSALKSGGIDLMRSIPSKDFNELQKNNSSIETQSKETYGFQYLGFNLNHPILSDNHLRKALALAVPKEKIIKVVFQQQAIPIDAPLSPLKKEFYKNDTNPFRYDLKESKQLLENSGWQDYNGDGILEKIFHQDTIPLQLNYHYNAGNDQRKSIGLILQNEFKSIGVDLSIHSLEWSTYLQKLRSNELELFYGGVISLPISPDFSSLFHSKSANGGRNYANYQNEQADSLIEAINQTTSKTDQIQLINEFIKLIHRDLPYYFLVSPKENIAYSKTLKNVSIYALRPNYWAAEIRLK